MEMNIVAVTACVSGVAHTYMAAERLVKLAQHEKWRIKVETQGALGIENRITPADIVGIDVVLLVADIDIDDAERFRGIRTVKTSIQTCLLRPQHIIDAIRCIMKKPVVCLEIP